MTQPLTRGRDGASGLHDPAPDVRPGKVITPWRIHCETAMTYFDEAEASDHSSPWPHGRRWVWASWIVRPASVDEQRERCLRVVEREGRQHVSIGLGAPVVPTESGNARTRRRDSRR